MSSKAGRSRPQQKDQQVRVCGAEAAPQKALTSGALFQTENTTTKGK